MFIRLNIWQNDSRPIIDKSQAAAVSELSKSKRRENWQNTQL